MRKCKMNQYKTIKHINGGITSFILFYIYMSMCVCMYVYVRVCMNAQRERTDVTLLFLLQLC